MEHEGDSHTSLYLSIVNSPEKLINKIGETGNQKSREQGQRGWPTVRFTPTLGLLNKGSRGFVFIPCFLFWILFPVPSIVFSFFFTSGAPPCVLVTLSPYLGWCLFYSITLYHKWLLGIVLGECHCKNKTLQATALTRNETIQETWWHLIPHPMSLIEEGVSWSQLVCRVHSKWCLSYLRRVFT